MLSRPDAADMTARRPDDCRQASAALNCPSAADGDDAETSSGRAMVLNARARQLDARKRMLERKAAEHNRNRAEAVELQAQLDELKRTADEALENERLASDGVSRDFGALSSKRDRTACAVDRLRRKNHELQCGIHAMETRQTRAADEIKRLEAAERTAAECVRELRDSVQEQLDRIEALKREQAQLENRIASTVAESDRCRSELTVAEQAVLDRRGEATELERLNAEQGRALSELTAECQARLADLDALRASGAEQLGRLDVAADAAAAELATARAAADRAAAEESRASEAYRRLQEAGDEEAASARAELRDRADERDRLSERLTAAAEQLAAANDERDRAARDAAELADRLAAVTADVERLERRARHERLVLQVARIQREAETALYEDEKTAKGYALELLETELAELRGAAGRRDDAAPDVVRCAAEPLAAANGCDAVCGFGSIA